MANKFVDGVRVVGKAFRYIGSEIGYFCVINARYAAGLIDIASPYLMYTIGQSVALDRGYFGVGSEAILPIVCLVLASAIRGFANRHNTGRTIPVPISRFTDVSEDGEVTIEQARLQEMILYVADLEDYLERKELL